MLLPCRLRCDLLQWWLAGTGLLGGEGMKAA